jgi:hypothetical protein
VDALAGWIGTLLGAVGLLLALSTVPETWADHHHALYVTLWVITIALLLIATALPLRHVPGWVRIRWKVRRAGRHPEQTLDGRMVPDSPTGPRDFMFTTNDEPRRHIRTPPSPVGLRITIPFEATVWNSSVPAAVKRYGKTIFRVTEFLPDGFVIADQSPGLAIRGEISYATLSQVIWELAPQETAPPPEGPDPHPNPEQ